MWVVGGVLLLMGAQAVAQDGHQPEEATPSKPSGSAPPADAAVEADSEDKEASGPRMELYGFAMLDMGYGFNQSDPNWFDVVRPSKLPSFPDEFGANGRFFSGVRQSRFGAKAFVPTAWGELKTIFEFELFGVGVDEGQTTFRLRHAWGELGQLGAGQTWSPFMDPDVFPNSIEYWGPNGMVFFRNVQLRWTPWQQGESRVAVALERPGASQDLGVFEDRFELENVRARFPLPDLSAQVRLGQSWGHVQLAGIVRRMRWNDLLDDDIDLTGGAWGWGVNLSSNLKLSRHVLKLQVVYGEGIQNYMNDAPADVAIDVTPGDPQRPIRGVALPVLGIVAFADLNWSKQVTSTVGYSMVNIQNTDAQADDAFHRGQYALGNVLFTPVEDLLLGPELQWARRDNVRDGFHSDDIRIQFSVKFKFDQKLGGAP